MRSPLLVAFLSFLSGLATRYLQSAPRGAIALCMVTSAFSAAALPATDARPTDSVEFAIVIPAILRLLENHHPAELQSQVEPASPISALQRVVLVSTLRSGFCMDLRLHRLHGGAAQVADWQVQLASLSGTGAASGARVEAFEGGWRVCMRRAGRFELALQHAFSMPALAITAESRPTASSPSFAFGWPVAMSLSTP